MADATDTLRRALALHSPVQRRPEPPMTAPKAPPILHGWDKMTVFQRDAALRAYQRRHRQFGELALDRSARTMDADGRLQVAATPITREQVASYHASEIPCAAALGLDLSKTYRIYRPADELAKAAPTFRNLPLLTQHVHVTADDHRPDLVVGSTGTDAVWDAPYVRVSLAVWAADAIKAINSGAQRELSAAYRYTAVPSPGTFEGQPYELRMTAIKGQHVALVDRGRAGPDVLVADAMPNFQRRKNMAADTTTPDAEIVSKLTDYLESVLTPEQMDAVKAILAGGDVQTPAVMAGDRARRAADAEAHALDFAKRFPNAARLKPGFR